METYTCGYVTIMDPLISSPLPASAPVQSAPLLTTTNPYLIHILPPEDLYGYILVSCHMTVGLMRRFSSSARTQNSSATARSLTAPRLLGLRQYQRTITDVRARPASVTRSWFTSSSPCFHPELDEQERQRLNERNLKLGTSMLADDLSLWH